MTPARRARLAADVSKATLRLGRLDELEPILRDRLTFYTGMVAAGDIRRQQGALNVIEQNLAGPVLAEAQLAYAIASLDSASSETNNARLFVGTLRMAVAGATAERARHVASIAAAELAIKAGA